MANTLVTGATGFTGQALCKRLVDSGDTVTAFVRPTSRIDVLVDWGVDCKAVDLTDAVDVQKNFDGFDKVFHIAAAYRSEHSDKSEFWRVNVDGTRSMLDAAMNSGVGRFIHCSTVGVQGEIEDPPADELYRTKPGDHYQDSKLEGELLAKSYFEDKLPGVVIRPVGIYGPGDTRFLKLVRAIARGKFAMIGTGKTLYHMTYIDDLIDGFLLASESDRALNEVFTIAGETYTTIEELVRIISDIVGKSPPGWHVPLGPVYLAAAITEAVCRPFGINPPLYPRRVEFFQLDRAFSIEKARKLLGYSPKVGLREGFGRTAASYRDEGLI